MYLTPLGLALKNAYLHGWSVCKSNVWNIACPGVFVVILNKRRAKLLHPAHAPDLHPCRPRRPARLPGAPAYDGQGCPNAVIAGIAIAACPSVDISSTFSASTRRAGALKAQQAPSQPIINSGSSTMQQAIKETLTTLL
ncbi:hypothetical protein Q7A_03500 [Methylophaga nitratireducenticrescens]|nr:hypothetical protein Q7A_03500 [Methylophaga nitratireducenticrescens]AUZ84540.1 hypothetical protein CDW43_08095 [Methylophaga nitratireducenticrescens]